MNRQPYHPPPRWWAPKLNPLMIRLWRPLRRNKQIRQQRLMQIDVRGLEHVHKALEAEHGLMLTPNHPSHADSYVLYHAAEVLRRPLYFMTAWQVFGMSGRFEQLIMQHHGCFSVDREGTDLRAFRQALDVLQNRPNPLVVFPEGDVYHLNDRVTPFREGAASIAMTAARKASRPIACVPTAIKYRYVTDPTAELLEVMHRLEKQIFDRARPELSLHDRIYRFSEGMIGLKEMEYLDRHQSGSLEERIAQLSGTLLSRLEERYAVEQADQSVPARVKVLRQEVIKRQTEAVTTNGTQKQLERDMDDLFAVTQMFSYPGNYVSEQPTIERMAETIDKFEEDFLHVSTATIRSKRHAVISFGEPLPVPATRDRSVAADLTRMLEQRVQELLDHS